MSDPYGQWGTVDEPGPPRRSRGRYVAAAAAVAVLAAIGGTAGYVLAGGGGTQQVAGTDVPTTSVSAPPTTAASSAPTGAPSSRPPASNPPGDTFPLPDVTGKDFEQARRELRELRLGVQVIFRSTGDDKRVERTEPAARQPVRTGITVKLYVLGGPATATVPGVVGLACDEAGRIAADHGLVPQYPDGRAGRVLRQDPTAPPGYTVRWNDPIRLYCGTASPSPKPSPSPG